MRSDSLRKVPTIGVATQSACAYAGPMPGKPFQSKLVPFETLIRDLRTAGRTYREISEILRKDHGIDAHPDTINSFVIVRARGAKVYALPEPQAAIPTPAKQEDSRPAAASPETPEPQGTGFFEAPAAPPPGPKKAKKFNLGY